MDKSKIYLWAVGGGYLVYLGIQQFVLLWRKEASIPWLNVLAGLLFIAVGGAVLVGVIGYDEQGWYLQPEQPLNVSYEYFLDKPSVFPEQTRISMFDPSVDGVEKTRYLDQTVTAERTFRIHRDDFETLYFAPYTITLGKLVPQSYGDPELAMPEGSENLLDPSQPLPKYMDPMIRDGKYAYNAFMLSEESLQLMGNAFAAFYVDFVDAFLNYRS